MSCFFFSCISVFDIEERYFEFDEGRIIVTDSVYTLHVVHSRTDLTNRWSVIICRSKLIDYKLV